MLGSSTSHKCQRPGTRLKGSWYLRKILTNCFLWNQLPVIILMPHKAKFSTVKESEDFTMNYLSIQVTVWNWHLQDHKVNHLVNSSSFWTLKGPSWSWHLRAGKGCYKSSRTGVIHPNTQTTSQGVNHKRTGTSWRQCLVKKEGLPLSSGLLLSGLELPEVPTV